MSSSPSTLELTIRNAGGDGGHEVVAQWRRPGEPPVRRVGRLELDVDELDPQDDPDAYGEVLGRAVFSGEVRDLFAQARLLDLRVLLSVESDELRGLRWERLAGPFEDEQWRLLGQSQRTPLSMHLPSGSDRRFPPLSRRELRALVVIANPVPDNDYGVEPFEEAEALDTVLEGLGEIPSIVLGNDPRAEGPPTLEAIHERLTKERFTLLHVVAHGARSRRGGGEVAMILEGEPGRTKAVTATALVERLQDLGVDRGLPHLAFLAVCDSAKAESGGVLGGLAQRMVARLGMPAVVAMTDRVSQSTAFTLGKAFYSRLKDHGEVDRALCEASVEVRRHKDVVVPVLVSRLGGRPLLVDESGDAPSGGVGSSVEHGGSLGVKLLAGLAVVVALAVVGVLAWPSGSSEAEPSAEPLAVAGPAASGAESARAQAQEQEGTSGGGGTSTGGTGGGSDAAESTGTELATTPDVGPAAGTTKPDGGRPSGTQSSTTTANCGKEGSKQRRAIDQVLQANPGMCKSGERISVKIRAGKLYVKGKRVDDWSKPRLGDCEGRMQCPD